MLNCSPRKLSGVLRDVIEPIYEELLLVVPFEEFAGEADFGLSTVCATIVGKGMDDGFDVTFQGFDDKVSFDVEISLEKKYQKSFQFEMKSTKTKLEIKSFLTSTSTKKFTQFIVDGFVVTIRSILIGIHAPRIVQID